jgi:hypothetical protein
MSGSFYTRGDAQGQGSFQPSPLVFIPDVYHDPTTNDINYPTCQLWFNPTGLKLWYLSGKSSSSGTIQATWVLLSSGVGGNFKEITTATDSAIVVPDPTNGNVTFESLAGTLKITNPAPYTVNYDLFNGKLAIDSIDVDAHTAPGTDPVLPSATGVVTITGGQVANGVVGTNVIRTDSLAANTFTIEIQRSTAVAASDITKNGVAHFDSADFGVDANGFVTNISGGFKWSDKSISFAGAAQNGYNVIGTLTATLPAAPANGDTIQFYVTGAFVLTLQANAGQTIQFSTNTSSVAGTQVSSMSGDSCELVYMSSSTSWKSVDYTGAWTPT